MLDAAEIASVNAQIDALSASIANDPEFQRLMKVIQQRVEAERAKVSDMEEQGLLARTPADLTNVQFKLEL